MKGLRIELGSELLDIICRDLNGLTFETHAQRQVFEPLDHRLFLKSCEDFRRRRTSLLLKGLRIGEPLISASTYAAPRNATAVCFSHGRGF
jgi:hypothetical protein